MRANSPACLPKVALEVVQVVFNLKWHTGNYDASEYRAHLRFSTISCIACGAEHGDREVVKRHGDHLGVLLRTTE